MPQGARSLADGGIDGVAYACEHLRLQQKCAVKFLDAAVRILEPIASGLEAAHRAGIVDRDLKPSNIRGQRDAEAVARDRLRASAERAVAVSLIVRSRSIEVIDADARKRLGVVPHDRVYRLTFARKDNAPRLDVGPPEKL